MNEEINNLLITTIILGAIISQVFINQWRVIEGFKWKRTIIILIIIATIVLYSIEPTKVVIYFILAATTQIIIEIRRKL